jgi:hypothetical protein
VKGEPAVGGRAGDIPLLLRVAWWAVVACDAIFAASVIAAARLFHRPGLYLSLISPLLGVVLVLVAWWHTRGRHRRR